MSDFELRRGTAEGGSEKTAILTVIGEVDVATSALLREGLIHCFSEANRVVVDARQVTFLDMTGAGLLVGAAYRAVQEGRRLIVMPSPRVRHLLALVDGEIDEVLPFDSADGRYVSALCRAGHHEDCIARPVVDCACPCHP